MTHFKIFILLLSFVLPNSASALVQMRFEHINRQAGLSNGSVTSIVQDTTGFIWVGTKNGLNRYDGNQFKVYHQKNSNISSNDISDLLIDSKSRMWVATSGGGVNLYNNLLNSFVSFQSITRKKEILSFKVVHTICEDKKGIIWIGTDKGLARYNEKEEVFEYCLNSFKHKDSEFLSIWSIYEDEKGMFWLGTYGLGLLKYNPANDSAEQVVTISKDNKKYIIDYINDIGYFGNNKLLIGTNGQSLLLLNTSTNVVSRFFENTPYDDISIIRTIWHDDKGTVWLGTDGDGLLMISKEGELINQVLHDKEFSSSLSNNTVNTFFEDNQSNIWIGNAWKGLNVLLATSNDITSYYSSPQTRTASPILSVFRKNQYLWMGTDGDGLSYLDLNSKSVTQYNKNEFRGKYIQCIKSTKDNNYWLGTFASGLILFNPYKGIIKHFKRDPGNKNSLPFNDVRDIIELPNGDLWVATWGGGLCYFNIQTELFTIYQSKGKVNGVISSNNVLAIEPNGDGRLWIATYGGGLNLFDPESEVFLKFKEGVGNKDTLGSNYIYSLLKGFNNKLWIGTKEGLNCLDILSHEITSYKIGTSLNSNMVVSLLHDENGYLWMGTKEGIYRFDTVTKQVEALTSIDDGFHINAAFKDEEGELYFAGDERVVAFNPIHFKTVNTDLNVRLTDFKLFNKSIAIGDGKVLKQPINLENLITLKHDQSVITFDFAVLNYPFANKIHFAVKMEGFEEDWRDVGMQRTATYTNLSSGEYTFKVRCQSDNGEWNNQNIASISLRILPPPWKTWWAYIIYLLIIVFILYVYRRYTLKWSGMKNALKLEKIQREQEDLLHRMKTRFFTNISHEIRTPLTLITGPLNRLLQNENADLSEKKQLSIIKSNTNRLMNLVNELLNFRKLEEGHIKLKVTKGNIVDFVNEIYLSYTQHAINNNIRYVFNKSADDIQVWFDKIQLEKALYNLLSNAFKFTQQENSITVEVTKQVEHVVIKVRDTGIGIAADKLPKIFERFYQNEEDGYQEKGFGIGLSIAKDIVELHKGTIAVQSELLKGSCFEIKLPLGKDHLKDVIIDEDLNEENIENYTVEEEDLGRVAIPAEEFKGSTILIVEDNNNIRAYLQSILSDVYIVFEASNGKEGIEKCIELVPDLVISDVMMPVMDGINMCRKLKSDIRISHVPVILLTARTLAAHKIEGYEMGADEYLTKPFNEKVLKARIRNLLVNRRMLSEHYFKEGMINPKEITVNSPDKEFLTKLVDVVEEHIEDDEFNIDQLSKSIAMSHSNVYKKIKALTGMTVIGFIKDYRLKRAAQLFKESKLPIIDVCFKVGYTNRRHFSQEFKKKYGVNPSDYIKQKRLN
ncbi:response regulator [Labilibacter sediminis]|nr:response regulator [Labilibacter sediminis]